MEDSPGQFLGWARSPTGLVPSPLPPMLGHQVSPVCTTRIRRDPGGSQNRQEVQGLSSAQLDRARPPEEGTGGGEGRDSITPVAAPPFAPPTQRHHCPSPVHRGETKGTCDGSRQGGHGLGREGVLAFGLHDVRKPHVTSQEEASCSRTNARLHVRRTGGFFYFFLEDTDGGALPRAYTRARGASVSR